jgi:hypothetical protein
MMHNKAVILSLAAILAVASFGFTSFGAVNPPGSGGAYSVVAIQILPVASSGLILTNARSGDCDDNNDGSSKIDCSDEDGFSGPDADENLAEVKISPQNACLCALAKLPNGTVVDSVHGIFSELSLPYYKVALHNADFTYTLFVNATNCNVVLDPNRS